MTAVTKVGDKLFLHNFLLNYEPRNAFGDSRDSRDKSDGDKTFLGL
jgi:hypothetical protein